MNGDPGIGIKWYTSKLAELGVSSLRVVAFHFRTGEISTGEKLLGRFTLPYLGSLVPLCRQQLALWFARDILSL